MSLSATESFAGSGHARTSAEISRIAAGTRIDFRNALVVINALRNNGAFAAAEVKAIELSRVAQEVFPANAIEIAEVINALGHIQTARGRYVQAIATYRRLQHILAGHVKRAETAARTVPNGGADLPAAQTGSDARPRAARGHTATIVSLLGTIAESYVQLGRPKLASRNLDFALLLSSTPENARPSYALNEAANGGERDDADKVSKRQATPDARPAKSRSAMLQPAKAEGFSQPTATKSPLPERKQAGSNTIVSASKVPDDSYASAIIKGKKRSRVGARKPASVGKLRAYKAHAHRRRSPQPKPRKHHRPWPEDPYAYKFHQPQYFPYDGARYWREASKVRPSGSVEFPRY